MVKEESPSKVDRIIEGLSEAENMMDEEFPDDDLLSGITPWHLFDYPYYPLRRVFDKLKEWDSINVIPSIYGTRTRLFLYLPLK